MLKSTIITATTIFLLSAACSAQSFFPGCSHRFSSNRSPGNQYAADADSTHDFDVLEYYLMVFPYANVDNLSGVVRIDFTPEIANLNSIEINAEDLEIDTIYADWGGLDYQYEDDLLVIDLGLNLQPGDTMSVYIEYTAPIIENSHLKGFHRTEADYVYTTAEPFGARRWFPCYDYPFDKSKVTVEVWVPDGYKAASNGDISDSFSIGDEDIYIWHDDDPIATYLISIACGPYIEMNDMAADTIPLLYYVYDFDSANAVVDFENTGDMLEFFSETFGDYPFQSYGMAEADCYSGWGAMEHQNMTTYGHHLVSGDKSMENVVSHELAHMWWGDALTPLTFADIWLNEGFAIYSEALYIESRYDTLAAYMQNIAEDYFNEHTSGTQYPIYNAPDPYMFGTAVYLKGGWVQHMLRNIVGDDAFYTATQSYFEAYKYGNVITDDYRTEMEAVIGDELDWFFDQWLMYPGFPMYDYQWSVVPIGPNIYVTMDLYQVQDVGPIFAMPIELYFTDGVNDTTFTIFNEGQSEEITIPILFEPTEMILDPDNKILKWDMPNSIQNPPSNSPVTFSLGKVYPNPFNQHTVLDFVLPSAGKINLSVYNIKGELITTLIDGYRNTGWHRERWNAGSIGSGVYLIGLESAGNREFRKAVLVK